MAWTSPALTTWVAAILSIIWCLDRFVPGAEFIAEDICNQILRNLITPVYIITGILFETIFEFTKVVFFGIFWILIGFCNVIASIFHLLLTIPWAVWNIIGCIKFVFLWTINFSIFTVPLWVGHIWKTYSVVSPQAIVSLFQNSATVQFWDTEDRPLHDLMANILLCLGILIFNILQVYMIACFIWNMIIYYNSFNRHPYIPDTKPSSPPRFAPGYNGFNKPMTFPASTGNSDNRTYCDASTNLTRSSPVTYGGHTYGEVSYGARTGNEYLSSSSRSTSVFSRPPSVRRMQSQSARFNSAARNSTSGPKRNARALPGLLRTHPQIIGDRHRDTPLVTFSPEDVQEPSSKSSQEESPEIDVDELTQQSIREDMLAESFESLAATDPTTPHSTIEKGAQMLISSLTKSASFVAGSARVGAKAVTSILKSATRRNGGVRRVLFRFGTETVDTLDRDVREDSVHSDRSHRSYASNGRHNSDGPHGSHASNESYNSHGYEGSQASQSSRSSSPEQGSQGFGQYIEEPDEDPVQSYAKSDEYHDMFITHDMAFQPEYPVPLGRGLPHYLNKRQREIRLADMWHVGEMELGNLPRNTAPPTDENHVHFAQQHGWVDPDPDQQVDSESDYSEPESSTRETPSPVTPRRSPRFKAQTPTLVASPSFSPSPASSNNSQRQAARERADNGGDRMNTGRDGVESRFGMRLVSTAEASPGAALFGVVINPPTAYPRTPIVSSSAQLFAPIEAGDLVLRLRPGNTFSTGKLEKIEAWDGPFVISSVAADFATLELPVHSDANRWVPLTHLKRYVGSITAGSLREATISMTPGLAAVKKVALVRDVRTMNGAIQLRVSWYGWPAEDDTWEPQEAIPNEVLEDFKERWEAAGN